MKKLQQTIIEYIIQHFYDLKELQTKRDIKLNEFDQSPQSQGRSSKTNRRKYAFEDLRINTSGGHLTARIGKIRKTISKLPYSLYLWSILSKFELNAHPYWIKKDASLLLYANTENRTYDINQEEETDEWNFISGDTDSFAPGYMKFVIRLFGTPPTKMSPKQREMYEKYVLLKQIGLVTGMAALFNEQYRAREKYQYYRFNFFDGSFLLGHEYMQAFISLFENEPIAKIYQTRHTGEKTGDNYILDAWSDTFAAYYMGFYLSIDADTPPPPQPFFAEMHDFITKFVYAFITRPYWQALKQSAYQDSLPFGGSLFLFQTFKVLIDRVH